MISEDQGSLYKLHSQINTESERLLNEYKTALVRKNMMIAFQ